VSTFSHNVPVDASNAVFSVRELVPVANDIRNGGKLEGRQLLELLMRIKIALDAIEVMW
jgi:hypothetical protein